MSGADDIAAADEPIAPGWSRRLLRPRPLVAAALAIGVLAFSVALIVRLTDSGMRGPYGRFPPPIAEEAPLHSSNVVAKAGGRTVVYGGLVIVLRPASSTSPSLGAWDIATGRLYWRYRRPVSAMRLDAGTGGLFVVSGRKAGARMALIDVRTGRLRWSHVLPGSAREPGRLVVDAGTFALVDSQGVTAIDPARGSVLWTGRWPEGCQFDAEFIHAAVIARTLAVSCEDSPGSSTSLVGFDARTGSVRWHVTTAQLSPRTRHRHDDDLEGMLGGIFPLGGSLVAETNDGATALIDASTGAVTARHTWKEQHLAAVTDGVAISECSIAAKDFQLCGLDPRLGKQVWRSHLPGPQKLVTGTGTKSIHVADGRVYAVTEHAGYRLVVLDARTGGVLGQMPLPAGAGPLFDADIRNGVVTLADFNGPEVLLAERPDLHATRVL